MSNLRGKIAWVTGAGSGIGEAAINENPIDAFAGFHRISF